MDGCFSGSIFHVCKDSSADNHRAGVDVGQGTRHSFGRGTGINSVSDAPKGKAYVNLNPETAFGPEVVTSFDFPETTLDDLTKQMQKLTGINLIMDGKGLKGKVSIMQRNGVTFLFVYPLPSPYLP